MLTSNEQQEFYRENGYLIIENVLSEERLKRIRDAAEERLLLKVTKRAPKVRSTDFL